ncbi:hypothetical protein DAEQUDRAFT_766817 [Daedalea quercina L-15889]|uniref:BTB domain-containing protein n=1 Tax=Daedalea quercina L-15889 TaxID=1314783 RepID=A0A165P7D5_9APHY|nr:hypothetical protein DAEQUDRAFT_766817 [Daedalea quercina L-15889]
MATQNGVAAVSEAEENGVTGRSDETPTSVQSVTDNTEGTPLEATLDNLHVSVKSAAAPFDNSNGDADAILRSADSIDFCVHKNILRIASPFFADLFSLPQPVQEPSPAATSADSPSLPIIPVSEDAQTFDRVLRMCYPVEMPDIECVQDAAMLFKLALKYDLRAAEAARRKELLRFCSSHPLEVYAEACRHGRDLEEFARRAADTFSAPLEPDVVPYRYARAIDEYTSHMDDIPASFYYRLLEVYTDTDAGVTHGDNDTPRAQISHLFKGRARADAIIRSADGVVFYVLRVLFSFASPVLAEMLSKLGEGTPTSASTVSLNTTTVTHWPVLELPEDGRTLALLLQLCYPLPDPQPLNVDYGQAHESLKDACSLYEAAKKYDVPRAADWAKRTCLAVAETWPVRVYFIASRYGWDDVAREAAWRCVHEYADEHVPEMETAPAGTYRRLLVYKKKCHDVILRHKPISPHAGTWDETNSYWCPNKPWQRGSGEMRFWRTMHGKVWDEASGAWMEENAVLPQSIAAAAQNLPSEDDEPVDWRSGMEIVTKIVRGLAQITL